jgi:DNA-binding protein YbaB
LSSPQRPEIARKFRELDGVRALLDDQLARMHAESFVATDEAGTVEVTVNGIQRLVDLRFDPRILNLGAQEATARINEALHAATQFARDCVAADVDELKSRVADAVAAIQVPPPPS